MVCIKTTLNVGDYATVEMPAESDIIRWWDTTGFQWSSALESFIGKKCIVLSMWQCSDSDPTIVASIKLQLLNTQIVGEFPVPCVKRWTPETAMSLSDLV